MSQALFSYSLRISRRSRNVRLRVTVRGGLEVVVPRGYDASRVPRLLERQSRWIREALERAALERERLGPELAWRLPLHIALPIAGRAWNVSAAPTRARSVTIRVNESDGLLLSGAIASESACRRALGRWLMQQAHEYLVPRLHALSTTTDLRFRSVAVRRQRTRWGSCSHRRSISLNAKLLFLPPELVDYVLIHELCHTVEMNHSRRFWDVVRRHSPNFRLLDRRLRDAWKLVPAWAS